MSKIYDTLYTCCHHPKAFMFYPSARHIHVYNVLKLYINCMWPRVRSFKNAPVITDRDVNSTWQKRQCYLTFSRTKLSPNKIINETHVRHIQLLQLQLKQLPTTLTLPLCIQKDCSRSYRNASSLSEVHHLSQLVVNQAALFLSYLSQCLSVGL